MTQSSSPHTTLAKDAIAVFGQMMQSLAHIAPAVAVVFTTSLILGGATSAAPLAVLISCLAVLPSVHLHAVLQSRWAGAGGYFAILPPAFRGVTGTAFGLLDLFYEPVITSITILGLIGYGIEPFLGRPVTFIEAVAISQLMILAIYYFSGHTIRNISKILFVFGIGEVALFLLFGVVLISSSPINSATVDYIFNPQEISFSSFGKAALFGVLMFIGFESGIPFSEETKNSSSSFKKGIWFSTSVTALMFLFSFVGLVVASQPGGILSDTSLAETAKLSSPFFDKVAPLIFGDYGKPFLLLILLLSTFSCCLASFGAGARNLFAFGRLGVLPKSLASVDPVTASPKIGNATCYLITSAIALGLTSINKPTLAFEFLATTCGTIVTILYFLVAVAVVLNFKKLATSLKEQMVLLLIGIIDGAIFGYIIYATIIDYYKHTGLLHSVPWILAGAVVLSFLWAIVLKIQTPAIIQKITQRD